VLVQHVIEETTFENAQSEATFKSRKDCDDVTTPQKRKSVSPGFTLNQLFEQCEASDRS
jgi:hypothetical protein